MEFIKICVSIIISPSSYTPDPCPDARTGVLGDRKTQTVLPQARHLQRSQLPISDVGVGVKPQLAPHHRELQASAADSFALQAGRVFLAFAGGCSCFTFFLSFSCTPGGLLLRNARDSTARGAPEPPCGFFRDGVAHPCGFRGSHAPVRGSLQP